MNTTFALIAFLALNPAEPQEMDAFKIDYAMSEQDCYEAVKHVQRFEIAPGVTAVIQPENLSCEEEYK
ncbi:hypothetical protein CC53_gp111 [Rhizobium phage vB_RleS_L338C]|uniref:hypothetical protein n=1 Tax=Rhizobium phage vB_RleS_L338C TaxID=1414737 RepID=UPI0003D7D4F7|nr:hypothetical protein CC53_gp111 [Rhizobium phage vB_RleS_L338C]AHC30528.1 hypothetical protein L338C_111 [Rhizobium phage vB_RleS_L338C]QNH72178.1 hypothetical protein P11VFA_039 [Rhizobium phage P11VFA]